MRSVGTGMPAEQHARSLASAPLAHARKVAPRKPRGVPSAPVKPAQPSPPPKPPRRPPRRPKPSAKKSVKQAVLTATGCACEMALDDPTPASSSSPFALLLDCSDALEGCLNALDLDQLCACKSVCSVFAAVARVLLRSVHYRGMHMRLHDILNAPWSPRASRAAILARLAVLPDEELLRADGPSRLPPLHAAVQRHSPLPVLEALATANGGAAARRRARGELAVHLAAEQGSPGVLSLLLAASPEGACQRNADGCLPLHLAAASARVTEAVDACCASGGSIGRSSSVGSAIGSSGSGGSSSSRSGAASTAASAATASVALLLSAYGAGASEWDMNGMLPLHHACLHRAPLALVQALLRAFPEGARHESQDGWIPLHLALLSQSACAVVTALLAAHPEGVMQRSEPFGCVALHFACKHCSGAPRVIDVLLAAFPGACQLPDAEGRLPLHVAAAHQADECTIAALLHAQPEAAAIADEDGSLPLHCAATGHASAAVVRRLVRAHPAALHVAVSGGCLPVHLAVRHGMALEALLALLHAAPSTVAWRTDNGTLPLHEATECGASGAVVDALLRCDGQAACSRTRFGRLPLELLARRGIVGTDAEDVSTRRSSRGGGGGGSRGGRIDGRTGEEGVGSTSSGGNDFLRLLPACTQRADEVVNGGRSRWTVVRAALGAVHTHAFASQHSLELQSADGRGHDRRRANW